MADVQEISLLFSSVALVAVLWSRHRLSVRHRECKRTLNRVANERDEAEWKLNNHA